MVSSLKPKQYDCAIIGGGPGGLISALYLTRFKRNTILINEGIPRAAWGPKVNNLIGYNNGISGRTLLTRIRKQIAAIGTLTTVVGKARVTKLGAGYKVEVSGQKDIFAKTVILATGIEDEHPAVSNLKELRIRGLLKYCSICDGYENSNQRVAVLAKDDFGIQKALFIGNWTKKISILIPQKLRLAPQRSKEIKAVGARVIRCESFSLTPTMNSKVVVKPDGLKPFVARVVYVELGCKVKDESFRQLRSLRRTKEGFIIATTEQRTSIPGIFAVGDCVNLLGQIAVAAGQAAVASTTIHNDLLDAKGKKSKPRT